MPSAVYGADSPNDFSLFIPSTQVITFMVY